MAASGVAIAVIILSQTVVGVLGNFSLLFYYLFLSFTEHKLRSTDLIFKHLIVANLLTLLCKGVPQTMVALGLNVSFSDFACKLLFYLHRVGRGMSIGGTCLLSIFQAITISSRHSRWAELKSKALKYVWSFIYPSWILYMLVNALFPMYMSAKRSNGSITNLKDFGFCSAIRQDKTRDSLHTALLAFPDVLCMGLMLWASSHMVFILHRHRQQVRHIRRTNVSPEARATKSILLLVSTFVCFYALSCIFQACLSLTDNPSMFLLNSATIFAACFPTVSPFVLMSSDPSVARLCRACIRNRRFMNLLASLDTLSVFFAY
ncbi:vomeronasal type-1 receptor 4-like [Lepus europaeus]|uniref:vomeronasal type-1 receptor 4-like n=1 Tax=Lepus europaeus TaxID=9983 RepID=UPI002B4795FD|nr:vomeronasal type-1 receptor 4-like [Lepus europaeus]